jgi:hypothetical protein
MASLGRSDRFRRSGTPSAIAENQALSMPPPISSAARLSAQGMPLPAFGRPPTDSAQIVGRALCLATEAKGEYGLALESADAVKVKPLPRDR